MSQKQAIRVMIVDDHEVVRRGLASYLAGSGEQAVRMCSTVQPDVVLMDIIMPHLDGVETTRRIKAIYPNVKILLMTGFVDAAEIKNAFAAGAAGFLLKSAPIDDLQAVIRTVHAGRLTFSPEVAHALLDSQQANAHSLTEREFEVLRLIVDGWNNPQIAKKLAISRATVDVHVSAIKHKLGVHNRIEVISIAMKENLLLTKWLPLTLVNVVKTAC